MKDKIFKLLENIIPIAILVLGIVSSDMNTSLLAMITVILYYIFITINDFIHKVESMEVVYDNN